MVNFWGWVGLGRMFFVATGKRNMFKGSPGIG